MIKKNKLYLPSLQNSLVNTLLNTPDMRSKEKTFCNILNQLHLLKGKCEGKINESQINRHFDRIQQSFQDLGYFMENPIGEPYDLTRLDCEASVAGEETENLKITEVIKPIIYFRDDEGNQIVQRAVVIVEPKK